MRTIALSMPPHAFRRQGCRRPTPRSCAAGANGTNMGQWWGARREAKASASALSKNKASAAKLSQQKETDSADVKRGGIIISGFLDAKVSYPSRRYPFDEFELLVRELLRALHH